MKNRTIQLTSISSERMLVIPEKKNNLNSSFKIVIMWFCSGTPIGTPVSHMGGLRGDDLYSGRITGARFPSTSLSQNISQVGFSGDFVADQSYHNQYE